MSLADKLAATRTASAGRIPPDRQVIMERATEDLRKSGILERIVPVGRPAPAFELANHDGRRVYARVIVYRDASGAYRARTTGTQSSGALTSLAAANGLAICPEDLALMNAGATATVEMLDWPEEVF